MALGRFENFHFETSPYLMLSTYGTTDGTVNEQGVGAAPTGFVAMNATSSSAWVEPEKAITEGNEGHIFDALSRMIVITSRTGGTGTWNGTISVRRTGNNLANLGAAVVVPLSTAPTIQTFDNPLDAEFQKSTTGAAALTDVLEGWLRVTPGQAVAATITTTILIVPGFVAAESNKGAILSAPQYLTNR